MQTKIEYSKISDELQQKFGHTAQMQLLAEEKYRLHDDRKVMNL